MLLHKAQAFLGKELHWYATATFLGHGHSPFDVKCPCCSFSFRVIHVDCVFHDDDLEDPRMRSTFFIQKKLYSGAIWESSSIIIVK